MGRLFKGIFTGGVAGFIAGLLLAPKKGEETRKELEIKARDISSKVKKISEEIKERIEELKGSGSRSDLPPEDPKPF